MLRIIAVVLLRRHNVPLITFVGPRRKRTSPDINAATNLRKSSDARSGNLQPPRCGVIEDNCWNNDAASGPRAHSHRPAAGRRLHHPHIKRPAHHSSWCHYRRHPQHNYPHSKLQRCVMAGWATATHTHTSMSGHGAQPIFAKHQHSTR